MKKLLFFLLVIVTFSCNNDSQINPEYLQENRTLLTEGQTIDNALKQLESNKFRVSSDRQAALRNDVCEPETEGTCTSFFMDGNVNVPGANGRPNCSANVTFSLKVCFENGVLANMYMTYLTVSTSGCSELLDYWDTLSPEERQISISSFEFQTSLIVERMMMDFFLGINISCTQGKYVQMQYVKNLCYTYCWEGKPIYEYEKSSCGYMCCTRKTSYCRNDNDELVAGNPSYIVADDGTCQKTTPCIGHEGPLGSMSCTQNECLYEVNPNTDQDQ